jgi:hypothetical protein
MNHLNVSLTLSSFGNDRFGVSFGFQKFLNELLGLGRHKYFARVRKSDDQRSGREAPSMARETQEGAP